jgi:hypothetical protein
MQQADLYLLASFSPASTVKVRAISGSALCDWVYPGMRTVGDGVIQGTSRGPILNLHRSRVPRVVILEFHGDDFTPCISNTPFNESAYLANYALNLRAAIDHLLAIGTQKVIVDEGPPSQSTLQSSSPDRLLQEYRGIVARYPAARVSYASAADDSVLTSAGRYAQTLPCLAIEATDGVCSNIDVGGLRSNVVRSPDGTHFCPSTSGNAVGQVPGLCLDYSSGAYRYALALAKIVQRTFPRTKPASVPMVNSASVSPSEGAESTLTIDGHFLSEVTKVCLDDLTFPIVDGVAMTASVPAVTSKCFAVPTPSRPSSISLMIPSTSPEVQSGTLFVGVASPGARSLIGISDDLVGG